MAQEDKKIGTQPTADDLEPYRRLVELQRQMIELVRQHQKTKSECAALREQLVDEMTKRRRSRWDWRRIVRRLGVRRMKAFPDFWKADNRQQANGSFFPVQP